MPTKVRQPLGAADLQPDPDASAPGKGEVVFLRGAVGNGSQVIREGQTVSYEVVQGEDGLWYAVDIIILDQPNVH